MLARCAYGAILLLGLCVTALSPELQDLVSNLDAPGQRIFLMSYPRSGNTWLRYCLEFLTQRSSLSRTGLYYTTQQPLGWSAGFPLDLNKTPMEKVHCRREIVGTVQEADRLIFLVRNPKETFAREGSQGLALPALQRLAGKGYPASVYFDNFDVYDGWNAGTKLLMYYEDLIMRPRETLGRVLWFLGESPDRLELFMRDYEKHQARAIQLYKGLRAMVNGVLFHSKKIGDNDRCAIDQWISCHYPQCWSMYIKDRYADEILVYERNS